MKTFRYVTCDNFYGLEFGVHDYRFRGLGFNFRHYKISWELLGLERGALSIMRITEELLGRSSRSDPENRDQRPWGSFVRRPWCQSVRTVRLWTNIHGVCCVCSLRHIFMSCCSAVGIVTAYVIRAQCRTKHFHFCISSTQFPVR
jgi:hypothetical protein